MYKKSILAVTNYGFDELKILPDCYESKIGSKKAIEEVGYKFKKILRNLVEPGSGRAELLQPNISARKWLL